MPTKNTNLNSARKNKKDEFYTLYDSIVIECNHYLSQFEDKVVYCNCDNPTKSNFFAYFVLNFKKLKLKKLICTHYIQKDIEIDLWDTPEEFIQGPYKVEITLDNLPCLTLPEEVHSFIQRDIDTRTFAYAHELNGDGSFKSPECIELLKNCDIVVTNPPFSLLAEFIATVCKYKKKLLILGNVNVLKHPLVFPHIKNNELTIGLSSFNNGMYFNVPDDYEYDDNYKFKRDIDGKKVLRVASICWYTSLNTGNTVAPVSLTAHYSEAAYPKYDNHDAIEVSQAKDIPCDYYDNMGVPISFMNKLCRSQFDLVDCYSPRLNNKELYARLIIKRRK